MGSGVDLHNEDKDITYLDSYSIYLIPFSPNLVPNPATDQLNTEQEVTANSQLSMGSIAGIAVGGGGAVILIVVVAAIAIPTALYCRRKQRVLPQTTAYTIRPGNALLVSSNQTMENYYDREASTEVGSQSNDSPSRPRQTERDFHDSHSVDHTELVVEEIRLHTNVAYGVHFDQSNSKAGTVTTANEREYAYTDHHSSNQRNKQANELDSDEDSEYHYTDVNASKFNHAA